MRILAVPDRCRQWMTSCSSAGDFSSEDWNEGLSAPHPGSGARRDGVSPLPKPPTACLSEFLGERFGFSEYPPPRGCPRVWVHAVSVGETNAAKPLIAECLKRWPEADFLLTHMTPTGRDAGKRIVAMAPDRISQCYLPYDTPGAMEAFFRETKPSIGIVMETEIWPTMMAEAAKWGVPMVLANARESQKSLDQALRVPRLMSFRQ